MDFSFITTSNIPNFVLIDVNGSLQLSPIYVSIGFALNDSFLENAESFTVFILLEQDYELDPKRDRAVVTIFDTTCKNILKHICIYICM